MKKAHWLTLILSGLILTAPASAEEKTAITRGEKDALSACINLPRLPSGRHNWCSR